MSSDSNCQKDVSALGAVSQGVPGAQSVDDDSLEEAISGIDAQNGLTATAPASSLNDPAIDNVPNIANGPISNLFNSVSNEARAQLGGNTVYFRPAYVLGLNPFHGAAFVTHEALHNLGLTDDDIMAALGLTNTECGNGTDCISVRLEQDCFQSPTLLAGLP
jgi:hypothetical protein